MKNLLIFFFTIWSSVVFAQTNISGLISSNTTWTTAGNPYIITGNTVVNSGVQLTIEAGVLVKFNANRSLLINGTMQAVGTETDTIVFTSNQSNPQPGYWGQIAFSDMSMDYDSIAETGNLMRYCKVEYGGGQGANANVYLEGSSIMIEHSTIRKSALDGIQGNGIGATSSVFRFNRIENNTQNGFAFQPGSDLLPIGNLLIEKNSVKENGSSGIDVSVGNYNFQNFSEVIIIENSIATNESGVFCFGLGGKIERNNVYSNTSFGIDGAPNTASGGGIRNNRIAENKIGMRWGFRGVAEKNLVIDNDSIGISNGGGTINKNMFFGNPLAIYSRSSHIGGPDTVINNVIVKSYGREAILIEPFQQYWPDSYYANNTIVDNSCSSYIIEILESTGLGPEGNGLIEFNTIVRNNTTSFNGSTVSYNPSGAVQVPIFNGINIYNNGSAYEMRCNDQLNINAQNCYWGTAIEQEIEDVVYHFIDNSNLAFVDYGSFQTTPDTTAPVTPPRNVSKVDLGNGQVKLCWDSNLEVDLAGYRVYYGNPTGYSFSNFIDVGNVNTYTLSGASINDSIAITAYDIFADEFEDQFDGNESWFTYAEDASLNANFSYSTDGLTVDFNLLATNADTIAWDFGEGSAFNDASPQHTFSSDSTYTVCLTVGNECAGLETVCQEVTVSCASSFDLIVQGDLEFCDGDSILLRAQPGLSDYQWNTGATTATIYASEEGVYYASGMSGNCPFLSDTVTVSLIEVVPTITYNENDLTCPENFVSYQWYLNDTIIAGATSQTITAQTSGNYTVQVVDDNGCVGTSYTLEFTLQVGITENGTSIPFSVYPNPNNGMFRLDMKEAKSYSVEVFNALGQSVFNRQYKPTDIATIELSSTGVYHLRVFIDDDVYVLKVVKK